MHWDTVLLLSIGGAVVGYGLCLFVEYQVLERRSRKAAAREWRRGTIQNGEDILKVLERP